MKKSLRKVAIIALGGSLLAGCQPAQSEAAAPDSAIASLFGFQDAQVQRDVAAILEGMRQARRELGANAASE